MCATLFRTDLAWPKLRTHVGTTALLKYRQRNAVSVDSSAQTSPGLPADARGRRVSGPVGGLSTWLDPRRRTYRLRAAPVPESGAQGPRDLSTSSKLRFEHPT